MPYGDRESIIGHGDRVVIHGARIAAELGMDELQMVKLRVACLLHDIGKMVIPDSVMCKSGPLNDDEYAVVKSHSIVGEKILIEIGMPEQAMWIRHHHERFDGTGYPDHLRGNQIPLESRIIFVADAFDAMTSTRPYRTTRSPDFALEEIMKHVGTQFDEKIVDAFAQVIEREYHHRRFGEEPSTFLERRKKAAPQP